MNKLWHLLLMLGVILPLSACNTHSRSEVAIEALYQHSQCQEETAKTVMIDNAAELAKWWQSVTRLSLPARELPDPLKQVDWNTNNIVVIYAGSQPSAGYAVDLPRETAQVENQTLKIDVRLKEPPADAMVAQVVTSPCVVIAANKNSYTTVAIKDQEGKMFPAER